MTDRYFVAEECATRVGDSYEAQRALLEYGLAETAVHGGVRGRRAELMPFLRRVTLWGTLDTYLSPHLVPPPGARHQPRPRPRCALVAADASAHAAPPGPPCNPLGSAQGVRGGAALPDMLSLRSACRPTCRPHSPHRIFDAFATHPSPISPTQDI